jgi:predicted aspartyl protease
MKYKHIAILLLFALGTSKGGAQVVRSPAPPTTPAIPAAPPSQPSATVTTGEDRNLRLTVPVMVNGQGPFNFVIDTGADRTVISTALAERLNLPTLGKTRVHAMNGMGQANIVQIDTLLVSTRLNTKVRAAALSAKDLGADGLLGVDSLEGLRITLDFDAKEMRAEPSTAPEQPKPKDSDEIVVTARSRLGQLVMVNADAEGEQVWAVVDTGAQNSVGNSRLRRLLMKKQRLRKLEPITMTDVLGQQALADYTVVESIRLGGVRLQNAAVAFRDVHPFKIFNLTRRPALLLGIESLRSFRRVTIDFAKRKITFILPR